jgi:hypothetical protein
MCEPMTILNGAFSAELVKGKWKYKPNYAKASVNEQKKKAKSEKEKPQFKFIVQAEKEAVEEYQKVLKNMTLDIVKFLKQVK